MAPLPYSDVVFPQALSRDCIEAFQESHRRAFEFPGAVSTQIGYDGSSVVIANVTGSRSRHRSSESLRLRVDYLFLTHFSLVRRANYKEKVDRLVGVSGREFFVPLPRVKSLQVASRSQSLLPGAVVGAT